MKLNLEVTEKDYVQAIFLPTRVLHTTTKALKIIVILFIIYSLIGSLCQMIHGRGGLVQVFILAILGVYLSWSWFYCFPRGLRQLYQQSKYNLTSECEIDDKTISFNNSLGNTNLPWNYFRKWRESKFLFVLYGKEINVFPKHCFSSEQDINDFRKLLIEKIGQKK